MTETFRLTLKLIVIVRETLTEMLTDTVAKARNRDQDCNSVSKRDGDTKIYSDSTSESDIDSDTDTDVYSDRIGRVTMTEQKTETVSLLTIKTE